MALTERHLAWVHGAGAPLVRAASGQALRLLGHGPRSGAWQHEYVHTEGHTPMTTHRDDAEAWHVDGVTVTDMWHAHRTLDDGRDRESALHTAVSNECFALATVIGTIEHTERRAEEARQGAVLDSLRDDPRNPSYESLVAAAANPDAFASLVDWAMSDLACGAPTGAPHTEELLAWAIQYGHDSFFDLPKEPWRFL